MEQIFVELYKHNDKWASAGPDFRAEFVGQLLKVMGPGGPYEEIGVEIITCSFNDPATPRRADHDFICVYRLKRLA